MPSADRLPPTAVPCGPGRGFSSSATKPPGPGAPILLQRFLRWAREHTDLHFEVCVLRDGPLVADFSSLAPVHVIQMHEDPPPGGLEAELTSLGLLASAEMLGHRRRRRGIKALRGFDVLYLNSVLSAPLLGRMPEIPHLVITHLHEMEAALRHAISDAERSLLVQCTDRFITCSLQASEHALQVLDGPPVHCHYGFIDPLVPDPEGSRRLRERLGIAPDALIVGGAGSVAWRKGTDLFAATAREVLRRRGDLDVHFVWAGGHEFGPDPLPIEEDRDKLDLDERLHLVGHYDSPATIFGMLDLFCLTSREDPFPLVMLEAASVGTPIVAFANGGVSELAAASNDPTRPLADVVPYLEVDTLADAIMELLHDPARREQGGARLREHVLAHHVTEIAAPLLYDELRSLDPAIPPARPAR